LFLNTLYRLLPVRPVVRRLRGPSGGSPRRVARHLARRRASRTVPSVVRPRPRSRSSLMEKRVLLAIVLSFLVLYTYQMLVVKPAQKPAPGTSAPSSQVAAPAQGRSSKPAARP